jgi:formyltetrahydrofolate deformylase
MDWKITDSVRRSASSCWCPSRSTASTTCSPAGSRRRLDIEIPCVISNHDTFRGFVEWHGIPFHHAGHADNKAQATPKSSASSRRCAATPWCWRATDPVAELCAAHPGKIINIHHSFLPSFVAKPITRPTRGVKLIGATCHYVTAELDQGPIIEQDVIRIDHSDSVEDMVRYGKDIEKAVLARGLRYHLEDRVLVHGNKTVVFR